MPLSAAIFSASLGGLLAGLLHDRTEALSKALDRRELLVLILRHEA